MSTSNEEKSPLELLSTVNDPVFANQDAFMEATRDIRKATAVFSEHWMCKKADATNDKLHTLQFSLQYGTYKEPNEKKGASVLRRIECIRFLVLLDAKDLLKVLRLPLKTDPAFATLSELRQKAATCHAVIVVKYAEKFKNIAKESPDVDKYIGQFFDSSLKSIKAPHVSKKKKRKIEAKE